MRSFQRRIPVRHSHRFAIIQRLCLFLLFTLGIGTSAEAARSESVLATFDTDSEDMVAYGGGCPDNAPIECPNGCCSTDFPNCCADSCGATPDSCGGGGGSCGAGESSCDDGCCPVGSVCGTPGSGQCCPSSTPYHCPNDGTCQASPGQCDSDDDGGGGGGSGSTTLTCDARDAVGVCIEYVGLATEISKLSAECGYPQSSSLSCAATSLCCQHTNTTTETTACTYGYVQDKASFDESCLANSGSLNCSCTANGSGGSGGYDRPTSGCTIGNKGGGGTLWLFIIMLVLLWRPFRKKSTSQQRS